MSPRTARRGQPERIEGGTDARRTGRGPRLGRSSRQDISDSVRALSMMLTVQRGELAPVLTLAHQYHGTRLGQAYANVADALGAGVPFAEALGREPLFPAVVGRMVAVGARSGEPGPQLAKAADLLDSSIDTSSRVKSALLEPALLLFFVVLFFILMVVWAIPQMVNIFVQFDAPIPKLTLGMLAFAHFMQIFLPVLAAVVAVTWVWWRTKGRARHDLVARLHEAALRVPLFGPLQQAAALANVFSVLGALSELGIAERDALITAAAGSENEAIGDHLRAHAQRLSAGEAQFADVADGVFIPLPVGTVLRASAVTGNLPFGLKHVAESYMRDARNKSANLATSLGPAANIVVGAVFAVIVIAVYLPMYQMFSAMTAF